MIDDKAALKKIDSDTVLQKGATNDLNSRELSDVSTIYGLKQEIMMIKEELEKLKRDSAESTILTRKNCELHLLSEQSVIKSFTLEINDLKQELDKYKTKLDNITKARVNKRNNEELEMMENFFRDYIVIKKGAIVKTLDVMAKMNEVFSDTNIRFNKFEIAKFMKDKGICKKKVSGCSHYIDIKLM